MCAKLPIFRHTEKGLRDNALYRHALQNVTPVLSEAAWRVRKRRLNGLDGRLWRGATVNKAHKKQGLSGQARIKSRACGVPVMAPSTWGGLGGEDRDG